MITGATSGLGREVAIALAASRPRLYLIARDPERAATAVADIRQRTGNTDVHVLYADLSVQREVGRVAEEFLATRDPLHVLVNNAGGVFGFRREVSADGIEMTFALNHLAYFGLTLRLLPRLRASAPGRIVNVASGAYKDAKGHFDFDDYNAERHYAPIRQYGCSKLANILFTRELARRISGTGVTANAATPPRLTGTRFAHGVHPIARLALSAWKPFALSPEKGAWPIVHLCRSPEVDGVNGSYWSGAERPTLTSAATDDADARRLWDLSASLTGLDADADRKPGHGGG
jgi:NAD(P)-dependent dehydrogenase (short-subunit alcohol dehydrogenase family)